MEKKLIAFAGRKHSGKSMFCNMLKERYGAEIITVAKPIKILCAKLLGVSLEELDKMKNDVSYNIVQNLPSDRNPDMWVAEIMSEGICAPQQAVLEWVKSVFDSEFYNVRTMLQTIGTDLIRKHDEGWHVRKMSMAIAKSDSEYIVVDDIRFKNEAEEFKKLGGSVFFIMRPDLTIEVSNHSSEVGLMWCDFSMNHIIVNMFDKEFMLSEFCKFVESGIPEYFNSVIFANHMIETTKVNYDCAMRRFDESDEYRIDDEYRDFITNILLPSALKHNGAVVIFTDRISVVNNMRTYLGYFDDNVHCGYELIKRSYIIWNPFLIENLKAWM